VNIVPDTELALQFSQKFWAPVSLTVRLVKLCEPVMDVVVLIKLVKPLLELSQDRLTVRDQQIKKPLVLLYIVWNLARDRFDLVR
jgi:hypothetical protein